MNIKVMIAGCLRWNGSAFLLLRLLAVVLLLGSGNNALSSPSEGEEGGGEEFPEFEVRIVNVEEDEDGRVLVWLQGSGGFQPGTVVQIAFVPRFVACREGVLSLEGGVTHGMRFLRVVTDETGSFLLKFPCVNNAFAYRVGVPGKAGSYGESETEVFLPTPSRFYKRLKKDVETHQGIKTGLDRIFQEMRSHVLEHGSDIKKDVRSRRLASRLMELQSRVSNLSRDALLRPAYQGAVRALSFALWEFNGIPVKVEADERIGGEESPGTITRVVTRPRDLSSSIEEWNLCLSEHRETAARGVAYCASLLMRARVLLYLEKGEVVNHLETVQKELAEFKTVVFDVLNGPFAKNRNTSAIRKGIVDALADIEAFLDGVVSGEAEGMEDRPSRGDFPEKMGEFEKRLSILVDLFSRPLGTSVDDGEGGEGTSEKMDE